MELEACNGMWRDCYCDEARCVTLGVGSDGMGWVVGGVER